jgi:hypothetical protein
MPISAQYLVKQCQVNISDLAGVRFPASELIVYLNDGQRSLVAIRPEASASTSTFVPVAGARQQLPSTSAVLIDIPRNTAGNKKAITKVSVEDLDSFNLDWRSMTGVTEILHFAFDLREPRFFDIYPPAAASGASIEVKSSVYPTDVGAPTGDGKAFGTVTGNISVDDQWAFALFNYMMSRAYSKDVDFGGNPDLATAYAGTFANLLGVQQQSSQSVSPEK